MSNNSKFENRIGEKFEKLTIIGVEEHIYSNNQKYHKFLCRCDCGNEFSMFSHNWKKTRKCRKCISDTKFLGLPQGISYHKKYKVYQARIRANEKLYHLGTFKDLDIAEKVMEEAKKNSERIEEWFMYDREKFILSVCPSYKFRHANSHGAASKEKKVLFKQRNARTLSGTMLVAIEHLRTGPLLLSKKKWRDGDWTCTNQTINALYARELIHFNEQKTECYLNSDVDIKLQKMIIQK